ncbi:YcxB family protein [Streptomyces sp. NPDC093261]|uniref:YcxB family protein n=1 Tax=Streptomyces sp. NPDC093261 TaxID=3366037 RepID=UPI00380215C4
MTEQAVERREDAVVLEYEHRQEEMAEALRLVLRRRGRAGLVHRPVFLGIVGLLGVVQLVAGVYRGDATGVAFGTMFVVWPLLMFRVPRTSARQLLRANQHHGVMRVTVAEEGVRVVSVHVETRMAWANYGSYAETERCFVLRSPDRAGTCAVVLVKRGVRAPEDVDRLRALLDRHLPRV